MHGNHKHSPWHRAVSRPVCYCVARIKRAKRQWNKRRRVEDAKTLRNDTDPPQKLGGSYEWID